MIDVVSVYILNLCLLMLLCVVYVFICNLVCCVFRLVLLVILIYGY